MMETIQNQTKTTTKHDETHKIAIKSSLATPDGSNANDETPCLLETGETVKNTETKSCNNNNSKTEEHANLESPKTQAAEENLETTDTNAKDEEEAKNSEKEDEAKCSKRSPSVSENDSFELKANKTFKDDSLSKAEEEEEEEEEDEMAGIQKELLKSYSDVEADEKQQEKELPKSCSDEEADEKEQEMELLKACYDEQAANAVLDKQAALTNEQEEELLKSPNETDDGDGRDSISNHVLYEHEAVIGKSAVSPSPKETERQPSPMTLVEKQNTTKKNNENHRILYKFDLDDDDDDDSSSHRQNEMDSKKNVAQSKELETKDDNSRMDNIENYENDDDDGDNVSSDNSPQKPNCSSPSLTAEEQSNKNESSQSKPIEVINEEKEQLSVYSMKDQQDYESFDPSTVAFKAATETITETANKEDLNAEEEEATNKILNEKVSSPKLDALQHSKDEEHMTKIDAVFTAAALSFDSTTTSTTLKDKYLAKNQYNHADNSYQSNEEFQQNAKEVAKDEQEQKENNCEQMDYDEKNSISEDIIKSKDNTMSSPKINGKHLVNDNNDAEKQQRHFYGKHLSPNANEHNSQDADSQQSQEAEEPQSPAADNDCSRSQESQHHSSKFVHDQQSFRNVDDYRSRDSDDLQSEAAAANNEHHSHNDTFQSDTSIADDNDDGDSATNESNLTKSSYDSADEEEDDEDKKSIRKATNSPINLPQNEEARIAFHSENNTEVFYEDQPQQNHYAADDQEMLRKFQTSKTSEDNSKSSCSSDEDESNLKINEDTRQTHASSQSVEHEQEQQEREQPADEQEQKQLFFNKNTNDETETLAQKSPPSYSSIQKSIPAELNEEDNASCSSAASSSSSSSSAYSAATSSSRHLIIDHPSLDDGKPSLKMTLKRKLSFSSATDGEDQVEPAPKQQHFEEKQVLANESELIEKHKTESREHSSSLPHTGGRELSSSLPHTDSGIVIAEAKNMLPLDENGNDNPLRMDIDIEGEYKALDDQNQQENLAVPQPTLSASLTSSPQPVYKSLLLEQLEKPLLNPAMLHNQQPLSLPMQETSAQSPQPKTKYLCFKCKTGSYDTFAALTEHQLQCLSAGSFLFPYTGQLSASTTTFNNQASRTDTIDSMARESTAMDSAAQETAQAKKRFYKCSSCNTFHENWNLFLHIREKHNRHMCLYCVRFFPTAEKLALHLEIKHDLEQNHFNSEEALRKTIPQVEGVLGTYVIEKRYLLCCTCQHVFGDDEQFSQHDCAEYITACPLCGQRGRHSNQCKAHPDSKRFSKLTKKKKEKLICKTGVAESFANDNQQTAFMKHPNHVVNPPISINNLCTSNTTTTTTLTSNTILNNTSNCDSVREIQTRPTTINALHSEESNSSSNMVIDESCSIQHSLQLPPANTTAFHSAAQEFQPQPPAYDDVSKQQTPNQLESDLPPDRKALTVPPLKLVVPKFKLRVPKEFQKSVNDKLSSSDDSSEAEPEEEAEENETSAAASEEQQRNHPKSELSSYERIYGSSDDVRKNDDSNNEYQQHTHAPQLSANYNDDKTEQPTHPQPSQSQYPSISQDDDDDDDDSLDEPNSSLVRIMQEIERTKLDIQRTKSTSSSSSSRHHHQQQPQEKTAREATISQCSNATADQNCSPTPPASPNSRWSTPNSRRFTISQSDEINMQQQQQQQQLLLLPPPSPVKATGYEEQLQQLQNLGSQERRDTIGSDMMDIDESITSQPTRTIYGDESRNELNTSDESFSTNTPTKDSTDAHVADDNDDTPEKKTEQLADNSQPESEPAEMTNDDEKAQLTPATSPTTPISELSEPTALATETKQTADDEQKSNDEDEGDIDVCDTNDVNSKNSSAIEPVPVENKIPEDGIEVASDDTIAVDLQLDRPLDKYETVDFVRICLKTVYPICLYCNHARRIAVNGKSLVLHLIGQHRFTATVDSITAEELQSQTIVAKLKTFLPELEEHYFNSNSFCTVGNGQFIEVYNERIFECFQCRFVGATHKELYLHNRKMHLRTAILCFMCRANFFSFSEILCHICPGMPHKVSVFDVKFRCCLCELDNIPSPFRLMVHLRKKHMACDVCLEDCRDQSKLSSHVWKHKLHHLCYRCGIAYRNKQDITKHLFWKHGTESTICKRCLQKKWRHVYHFCIPPQNFVCEVCNLCFSRAMYLRVHRRLHTGDLRYPCIEDECEEKFISRKLLLKHAELHVAAVQDNASAVSEEKKLEAIDAAAGDDDKENKDVVKQEPTAQLDVKKEVVEIKKEPQDEEAGSLKEIQPKEEGKETAAQEKDKEKKEKSEDKSAPRKKRKKNKRSKELLADLNLEAPNLSETDSNSDSDSDSKTRSEFDAMPPVMLSPPSEADEDDKDQQKCVKETEPSKVLEIWQNFLKNQQQEDPEAAAEKQAAAELEAERKLAAAEAAAAEKKRQQEEKQNLIAQLLEVIYAEHDYCKTLVPPSPTKSKNKKAANELLGDSSPLKKKHNKSPRRVSSRRSDSSSSSGDSSSSSGSSCSCGSNCSCSSGSGSDSSSNSNSSNSSDDSESSAGSNNSQRKRHRKKSERDRMRKRSESISPLKHPKKSHHSSSADVINVEENEDGAAEEQGATTQPSPPTEPLYYESDLETNESETDEEFYDEHPQKLATELLAQKRAQLMAQTRLSPSHNYDIVENSRPSTPSLPEEAGVAAAEKPKIKVKKKKRDRKSSCKGGSSGVHVTTAHLPPTEQELKQQQQQTQLLVPAQACNDTNSMLTATTAQQTFANSALLQQQQQSLINPLAENHMPTNSTHAHGQQSVNLYAPSEHQHHQHHHHHHFTPRPVAMPYGGGVPHRMSEGSSCSDADGSLKRSKRARRPNKFYGYTSDDENMVSGPPLMIGMKAYKPQPPPQLTWRKEDLPAPSKSILHNKNKVSSSRLPKTPGGGSSTTESNLFGHSGNAMSKHHNQLSSAKKKSRSSLGGGSVADKSSRKRPSKKRDNNRLPPIPTLKIRPSELGLNSASNSNHNSMDGHYNSTTDTSDSDDDDDDEDEDDEVRPPPLKKKLMSQQQLLSTTPAIVLPSAPPPPPVPQTTAFNHKIPPALLPNPDFATLQYFKANNIRYPIRPPNGARQAREGESVYCYCRCPYDEVSEMIACDGDNCLIEWFHFECVGIMVAPQGKWFCAECRPKYSEELYPSTATGSIIGGHVFSNV